MSDEEDLFADSDDEDATPAKKAPPPKAKKSGGGLDDLVDSDDEGGSRKKPAAAAAPLSRKERLEALAKKNKKRDDGPGDAAKKKRSDNKNKSGNKNKESGYDSGDSYGSENFTRTKEDDDFIDTTGEDADAVAELYADQHFDDERGEAEEEVGVKKKGGAGGKRSRTNRDSLADEKVELDENGVPINPIMAAVHRMKKKKRVEKGLDELEAELREFIGTMEYAAEQDEQAVAERRPAMHKLQHLGTLEEYLQRQSIQRQLLDMNVLAVCKRWIQPLTTGKLGNVTVRQRVLHAILQMNTFATEDSAITPEDLKASGVGRVVMVLYKHPDETVANKKLAKQLIEQWSRPIFQKSGNMKDLQRMGGRQSVGLAAISQQSKSQQQAYDRQEAERRRVDTGKHANLQSLIATGKGGTSAEAAASANRVRVPFSRGFAYSVQPASRKTEAAAGAGAADDKRGKLAKRMVEKGRTVAKNQRSANLSVEGRATKG